MFLFSKITNLFKRNADITNSSKATTDSSDLQDLAQITINQTDNATAITMELNEEAQSYISLSDVIQHSKNIYERIAACEESLKSLPDFVKSCLKQDGDLPPVIPCRDYAPQLYMNIGQWDNAEKVIRYCISIHAYYPAQEGKETLAWFNEYKKTALKIITYLESNPGTLQKNIYKVTEISEQEKSNARHFCRYSLLLRKEPYGKTNKLYLTDHI